METEDQASLYWTEHRKRNSALLRRFLEAYPDGLDRRERREAKLASGVGSIGGWFERGPGHRGCLEWTSRAKTHARLTAEGARWVRERLAAEAEQRLPPTVELDQARHQLRKASLAFPPLPDELAAHFQRFGPWWWGTRELNAFEMYLFGGIVGADGIEGPPPDYMALCHAGHGVNSYALNYQLVFRPVAIIFQVGWGGIYGDKAKEAARFRRQCELAAGLVDVATKVRQRPGMSTDVALIRYSDIRSICRLDLMHASDLIVGSRPSDELEARRPVEPEVVYERARAWLTAQI